MSAPCDREALEALVRGELPPEQVAALKVHTQGCAVCNRELLWLKVEQDLMSRRQAGPPMQLWPGVADRIAEQERRRTWWRLFRLSPWLSLGTAAASLFIGVFAVQHLVRMNGHRIDLGGFLRPGRPPRAPAHGSLVSTATVAGPVTLRLATMAADVEAVAGPRDQVTLALSDSDARSIRLVTQGQEVRAQFSGENSLKNGRVRLSLPQGSHLHLSSLSGEILVDRLGGEVYLKTASGDVRVVAPSRVEVETQSGDIEIEEPTGAVRIRTVAGEAIIQIPEGRPAPEVSFHSTAGDLEYHGPCGRGCRLSAHTVSGEVRFLLDRHSSANLVYHSQTGEVHDQLGLTPVAPALWRLGRGEGTIECHTMSGDVTVDPR